MQKIYKVAIVGGGASGLMAAVELLSGKKSLRGSDVIILEKNDRVGKKLIATGNGQGNLMNQNFGKEYYRGEDFFVKTFVDETIKIDLEKYLTKLGIPLCTLSNGKKYPLSRQASAVLDIIRAYLASKFCEIETDACVTAITERDGVFTIKAGREEYYAQSVILAFGGAAAKQFGTDGSSYVLAQKFGHKITSVYPSLVQLKTVTDLIKGLKGLKEVARVTLYTDDKAVATSTGDLLFTDYGVSGNTVFQVSAYYKGGSNSCLKVEFLPEMSEEEITKILSARQKCEHIAKDEVLLGILNKRVGQAVIKTCKSFLPEKVAHAVKNFRLKVTGSLGFNYAQVTKGGVVTENVNPLTFESKLKRGLYIVGEALDVDGDCGGYNITFAFASGIMAARGIKQKELE